MKFKINIMARTDIRGCMGNQDSLWIEGQGAPARRDGRYNRYIDSSENGLHVAAVADGVGDTDAGKMAAITALSAIKQAFEREAAAFAENPAALLKTAPWEMQGHSGRTVNLQSIFEGIAARMLDAANDAVCRMGSKGVYATTISMMLWSGKHYCLANIGDSPIFLYRSGAMVRQSVPHTAGYLAEMEGRKPTREENTTLVYYLGNRNNSGSGMMYLAQGEMKNGDLLLLCTNGLTDMLSERKIEGLLARNRFAGVLDCFWKEMDKKVGANPAMNGDNCTVILLEAEEAVDMPTLVVRKELYSVRNGKMMEEFWQKYGSLQTQWEYYIDGKIARSGLKKSQLTTMMFDNLNNVPDWLKKNQLPSKRDNLIFLGIACGFGREEIDEMLQKAYFHKLYEKDLHDAVLVYMIEHRVWNRSSDETISRCFESMYAFASKKQAEYLESCQTRRESKNTLYIRRMIRDEHVSFENMLSELFQNNFDQYHAFMSTIDQLFDGNGRPVAKTSFYCSDGIRERYYKAFAQLRNNYRMPSRTMLVAVATQLNLTLEKTNELLDSAGMARLYPKDPLEHIIIFLLNDLYESNPVYAQNTGRLTVDNVRFDQLVTTIRNYGSVYNVASYIDSSIQDYIASLEKRGKTDPGARNHAAQIRKSSMYQELMELYS